jgi:hypothetical protein
VSEHRALMKSFTRPAAFLPSSVGK